MRFSIRPGEDTVFDVELTLFPREDIAQPGIATMTSMFLFAPLDRGGADDYRRAVHDSDGLMMLTGRGETLWRPVANPRTPETADNLMLRRGFSYTRGFDGAGRLDQGLAFVSYQRSLERSFLAVQQRLSGEGLEEYILPEGGGFFFALPGAPGPDRFLGDAMLG